MTTSISSEAVLKKKKVLKEWENSVNKKIIGGQLTDKVSNTVDIQWKGKWEKERFENLFFTYLP